MSLLNTYIYPSIKHKTLSKRFSRLPPGACPTAPRRCGAVLSRRAYTPRMPVRRRSSISSAPRLLRSQRDALRAGVLEHPGGAVLCMPTGSGKTYLSETAIAQALAAGRRAIYLAPLRALAAELYARWSDTFAPHAVGIFTGEYGAQAEADYPVTFEAARLLIMTPERLEACTRDWHAHWGWIPEVDLVVADELHLLGDGHRGATLESALTRLRRLNPLARVWGLSATLGNVEELAGWLGAKSFQSTWRPVPLNWTVLRYAQASDKPRLCREAVARNVAAGGASLVFVQSRRRAESVALALAEADLRAAAHHAGLSRARRTEVEDAFRADALDVVVCTPTLEMGLNLPARQ